MKTHKHHIIPRHAGGTDDPSNLVELTILDHAIHHKVLYGLWGRWQDNLAWLSLKGQLDGDEIRRIKTSEANKGPRTGRRLEATLENGKKGSQVWKGQKHTEESKLSISKSNKEYWSHQKERPWQYVAKFMIEGVSYTGTKPIEDKYGVTRQTIYNRCKNDRWADWMRE